MSNPRDIAASVSARLSNYARDHISTYQEVLQYYAIERFLYRLATSKYRDAFVLKGGVAFFAWRFPLRRATRDIDLHGRRANTVKNLESIVKEICEEEVYSDGMLFDADSVTAMTIQEQAEYQGVRVRFTGKLGTALVPMQLDVGFSDVLFPAEISVEYPTILEMPAPILRAYSWETAIAEKFHAMVFLGSINSRMKDYYDIWLLTREATMQGSILQGAIQTTFENRSTMLPLGSPVQFSQSIIEEKQRQWRAFVNRENMSSGELDDFSVIVERINYFLSPIVEAIHNATKFKPSWVPAEGWTDVR